MPKIIDKRMNMGKKKPLSLTQIIREYAEKIDTDGNRRGDLIVKKLFRLAVNGEQWAIKEILDRMEGKAVQRAQIDHTSGGESLNAGLRFISAPPPVLEIGGQEKPGELPEGEANDTDRRGDGAKIT